LTNNSVLVLGDSILDRHIEGTVGRVSPEAPSLVHDFRFQTERLGGAANVAALISDAGVQVSYLSTVGTDQFGQQIFELLKAKGVSSHLIRCGKTTTKTRVISNGHHLIRLDNDHFFDPEEGQRETLTKQVDTVLRSFSNDTTQRKEDLAQRIVVFSDYNKGLFRGLFRGSLWSTLASNNTLIVDPKIDDIKEYRGAFLVKPNRHEFLRMFGQDPTSIRPETVFGVLSSAEISNMLVTLGADGALLYESSGMVDHFPGRELSVPFQDPTGAGDVVTAVLAFSLARGQALHDAVRSSMEAAGRSVQTIGNADWGTVSAGLGDIGGSELPDSSCRDSPVTPRVVFVNGCFDLLHHGHYNFLRASRSHGDLLLVGLNSDKSIHRLKGPGRPILPFAVRKQLLLGTGLVDEVFEFDESDASRLLEGLTVHVYARSTEYSTTPTAEDGVIKEKGILPVFIDRVPGVSTSSLGVLLDDR